MFKPELLECSDAVEIMKKAMVMLDPYKDVPLGEATEFVCHCGGTMHRFDPVGHKAREDLKKCGKPRYSRRKRQAKKNHKAWKKKHERVLWMSALMMPLRHPMSFKCATCGVREGFYSMMAKAMFRIQPMPEGAKVVY